MSATPQELSSDYEDAEEQQQEQRLDSVTLNNANMAITKANLQRHAWEDVSFAKVNFNSALKQANDLLEDTFGLSISELPVKAGKNNSDSSKKKDNKPQSSQQYVLTNKIVDPYARFQLESQWLSKANSLFQSELMEERHDYRNNKETYPTLTTDKNLVSNGLTLMIISIIMVSNNHISEGELLTILNENFGINTNTPLEILNIPILDFFKILDKQEYLIRSSLKSDNEEIVEYSIGRRSKIEFNKESFVEFARIIYNEGDDESDEFLNRVYATIDSTFGSVKDE
ncbi:Non-structural maintenance of chromosome element 3 [Wickerhamomyces ciferrii]|uniref:Non-structural maintenance of chromosome element 3 n=1 Tax=Wickerhamomyces ciferrii (strain ATCC 14091 / BCRC 22168 / CBS 111 / JCM 3599 / NBRC 0793 / NRRL Y-1031 F-60-10) TaxID=1206466 RepID=K0KVR5_WICCF|nr:Non-structural maintenance of chromosome element 3 [Wickerhamomyces ciferrii]CCH45228.1 Non-structural maintenance of chromosome element 3 [Wickerhamomyces ciferrii]